nr:hypothetical protein [uncultured Flavobacterium sp.]
MTEILAYLGDFFLLINLVLFSKGFSKQGKAFAVFTIYLGLVFAIQVLSSVLTYMKIGNLFLSHFYFILQFIVLSIFYGTILKEDFQKKAVKIGLIIGVSALVVQYMWDFSNFQKFNLFEIFITSFLLIIYAAFHFYNLLNDKKEFYYINMGILLYLFGSTVLFLAGNLMDRISPDFNKITWMLNTLLYIVYQLFVLIEWKKSFSKRKSNPVT